MGIEISAIICTHNRAAYLSKALKSLITQSLRKEFYEILVVDNASTDSTKVYVQNECAVTPNLRYIYEPVLGLNHARNAGWKNARGTFVAYLDDDAIACPVWLEKILEAFEAIRPTPGCVGGKIEPIWEAPRPSWLPDSMLIALAILDWSASPMILKDDRPLAGVNIGFQKVLLEKIGGFQIGLDRSGKNLLSNGDILAQRQVRDLGYACFYHPEIAVSHHVAASRLTKEWFAKRYYWQGISDVLLNEALTPRRRLTHLRDALGPAFELFRIVSGGHVLPRKLYWHISNIKFDDWVTHTYAAGKIRQNLNLAFSLRKL